MPQIIKFSKYLLSSIDIAKINEVDIVGSGSNCENETIKRLLSKNLNRATGYLNPMLDKSLPN